ncbi:hypothetical protein [Aminobacter niigataensis]|nr:hypothetical protein [Aminobacter niigataensis]
MLVIVQASFSETSIGWLSLLGIMVFSSVRQTESGRSSKGLI